MHPTILIRHAKENKKKCTLQPLFHQEGFIFFTYPNTLELPDLSSYVLLSLDGEAPLSEKDQNKGLILLDGTWKYASVMQKKILEKRSILTRSLPSHYQTAYPRRQTACQDPQRGLASIEALYIAYHLLGRSKDALLDAYPFKEAFLEKNNFF